MKNRILLYIAISFVLGALCYLLTTNLLYSIIVLALGIVVFLFLIEQLVSKHQKRMEKGHETYRFINSFIISLSTTKSIDLSFQNALLGIGKEENKIIETVQDKPVDEKLSYLSKYFDSDIYKVFLSTIRIYQEEGGEILDVAGPLLRECTAIEEDRIAHSKNITTAIVQFASLWAMSLFVMGVLRFGLSSFYETIVKNTLFIVLTLAYFFIAYISFVVFALGISKEKLNFKGENAHVFKKKRNVNEEI